MAYGIKPLENTMTEDQKRRDEADRYKRQLARAVARCSPEVKAHITSMERERARSRKRIANQRAALKQLHRAHIVRLYELDKMMDKLIAMDVKLRMLREGAA